MGKKKQVPIQLPKGQQTIQFPVKRVDPIRVSPVNHPDHSRWPTSPKRLHQSTLHQHPQTAAISGVLRNINSKQSREKVSVLDKTRQVPLDRFLRPLLSSGSHLSSVDPTPTSEPNSTPTVASVTLQANRSQITVSTHSVQSPRQSTSINPSIMPAAASGAAGMAASTGGDGGNGGGGGSSTIASSGDPVWGTVAPHQIRVTCERKQTWVIYSGAQPDNEWQSITGKDDRNNNVGLHASNHQWYLIPNNYVSFYLDQQSQDVITQGTAWRIASASAQIDDAKCYSFCHEDPNSTTPTYNITGNSVVDLEMFSDGSKQPGVFFLDASQSAASPYGWQLDGSFTTINSDQDYFQVNQTNQGNSASIKQLVNRAEQRYERLPAARFLMPRYQSTNWDPQGYSTMDPSKSGRGGPNSFPWNRYTEVYRCGGGAIPIGSKFIKGWRLQGRYFGGHRPVNGTTYPSFNANAQTGILTPNLPEETFLKPSHLVTSDDGVRETRVAPTDDFMGMDPKEYRWFFRTARDQILPHQAHENSHHFIRVRPIPAQFGDEQEVFHKVCLDISTYIEIDVLMDDMFPLSTGVDLTGNYNILERSNDSPYTNYNGGVYYAGRNIPTAIGARAGIFGTEPQVEVTPGVSKTRRRPDPLPRPTTRAATPEAESESSDTDAGDDPEPVEMAKKEPPPVPPKPPVKHAFDLSIVPGGVGAPGRLPTEANILDYLSRIRDVAIRSQRKNMRIWAEHWLKQYGAQVPQGDEPEDDNVMKKPRLE